MSDITETKVSFAEFTYKQALSVLPDWHTTQQPTDPETGDFQIRKNISGTRINFLKDLYLNVYKEKKVVALAELREGSWTNEIALPLVNDVFIKIDPTNVDKSELIFESDNFRYSISNKGLNNTLTKKEGGLVLKREFEIGVPLRER